jgi:hypothetical protein
VFQYLAQNCVVDCSIAVALSVFILAAAATATGTGSCQSHEHAPVRLPRSRDDTTVCVSTADVPGAAVTSCMKPPPPAGVAALLPAPRPLSTAVAIAAVALEQPPIPRAAHTIRPLEVCPTVAEPAAQVVMESRCVVEDSIVVTTLESPSVCEMVVRPCASTAPTRWAGGGGGGGVGCGGGDGGKGAMGEHPGRHHVPAFSIVTCWQSPVKAP